MNLALGSKRRAAKLVGRKGQTTESNDGRLKNKLHLTTRPSLPPVLRLCSMFK
ncbi:unnamed protein product [Ectocarpus sp. CCAP 1310/34]|nr:unnamed protein product [Ectocarpus sp. CCAP 1310/34]